MKFDFEVVLNINTIQQLHCGLKN